MPMKHQDQETHSAMAFVAIYFVSLFLLTIIFGIILTLT